MKKTLYILGICLLLLSMPAMTAVPVEKHTSFSIHKTPNTPVLDTPVLPDYDGTFVGGIGEIYRENEEWMFDTQGYLAGVYKGGRRFHRLLGNIYNLEEEKVGGIAAFFGHKIIIGFIQDGEENRAPIIGFLFYNDEYFAGRIMSLFGPAPHIWGAYTPV